MPEVTVRDAQPADAPAIAAIGAAAVPYLVRSPATASADMRADRPLGRRRWVGLIDDLVCGTAVGRYVEGRQGGREVDLAVEVDPAHGSRGVGTALLRAVVSAFDEGTWLRADSRDDPISMAFAMRNGFLPEGERPIGFVQPSSVPDAGEPPEGLRVVTLDALPDLRMLLETNNLAAADDPTGVVRRRTMYQLRAEWWDRQDFAPDLSFGLLPRGSRGPVLAAYTSVDVERERGRAWSTATVTHPSYRRRGLATWVKQRMLNAVAEAGVDAAWSVQDPGNPAMAAVDGTLGYEPVTRAIRVARRGGRWGSAARG
jgi:RimJ/RimL family protein N-acetyltransferase